MPAYRFGFVFDYELGHITHQKNLERFLAQDPSAQPEWLLIKPRTGDLLDRLPLVRNHLPIRQSLRARRAIRPLLRGNPLDAVYCHTQVTAMLGLGLPANVPLIISLDATQRDFARLGAYHAGGRPRLDKSSGLKYRWARWAYHQADALVTFSAWCKRSLVQDYGVDEARVAVIPPGVELAQWQPAAPKVQDASRKTRLLFVGGGFGRKGGHTLLQAFRDRLSDRCELDIVSNDAPDGSRNVRVHRGLQPNTPELRRLFAEADLFVFPSRGDCTPWATIEAMASGLPIITTSVGGLPEQVTDGVNGLLIPPNDPAALAQAVEALAADATKRSVMSAAGRERAERWFDARKNYRSLITLLKSCVDASRAGARAPAAASYGLTIPAPA